MCDWMAAMAMTQQVKAELATVEVTRPTSRRAEVTAMLRFAGGLHLAGGRILIEAELDTGAAARRLSKAVADLFGYHSDLVVVNGSGLRPAVSTILTPLLMITST